MMKSVQVSDLRTIEQSIVHRHSKTGISEINKMVRFKKKVSNSIQNLGEEFVTSPKSVCVGG